MKTFYLLILIIAPILSFAQGLIVNEISNGDSGVREYYELVVIGSSADPLGLVDLGGWIIDDNNGDFEGAISGVGIAQGHIRIKPGYLSAVKPGSILLIYNSSDVNPNLNIVPDPTDANEDCVYIIPIDDPCLEQCSFFPSASPTFIPTYLCLAYSNTTSTSWSRISLANSGDAAQVRKPDGSFFHGFSYGGVLAPFPTFPFGGTSFNIMTGSGGQRNYSFGCGSFVSKVNFSRGTAPTNETPGLPNNDANTYFINLLRNGTYNYTNLSDIANCGTATTLVPCSMILPIKITQFRGVKVNSNVDIQWTLEDIEDVDYIDIEKSSNGYELQSLDRVYPYTNTMRYTDRLLHSNNYYRLKIVEYSGEVTYSDIIHIVSDISDEVMVYLGLSQDIVNIKTTTSVKRVSVHNSFGTEILVSYSADSIDLSGMPRGFYVIRVDTENSTLIKKIILN